MLHFMGSSARKFLFIVQGEGRGHMSQAIGLSQILKQKGHELTHVFIGKSKRRKIPSYFLDHFDCPTETLDSPNFVTDRSNKAIRLGPSIFYNIRFLKKYWNSIVRIDRVVKHEKPDSIICFYDFLGGIYNFLYKPRSRFFAVGHPFLSSHPQFSFPVKRGIERRLFFINNLLNGLKAHKKIALSFRPYNPLQFGNTVVVPPILREELNKISVTDENYLLCYMVNDGYGFDIIRWHEENPGVEIHCFWDRHGEPETKKIDDTLTFHQIDDIKFLEFLGKCRGLITTAGFESVCEAMYLGKPVLMVPVEGQYEQACNAIDAVLSGAGIQDTNFNISRFLDYLTNDMSNPDSFKQWHARSEELLLNALMD